MIKIYTTETCSRCKVLKIKMDAKGIPYESVTKRGGNSTLVTGKTKEVDN